MRNAHVVVEKQVVGVEPAIIPGRNHTAGRPGADGWKELIAGRGIVVQFDFRAPGGTVVGRAAVVNVNHVAHVETVRVATVDHVHVAVRGDCDLRGRQVANVTVQRWPGARSGGARRPRVDAPSERVGYGGKGGAAVGGAYHLDVDRASGIRVPTHPGDIQVAVGANGGPGALHVYPCPAQNDRRRPGQAAVRRADRANPAVGEVGPGNVQTTVEGAGRGVVDRHELLVIVGTGVGHADPGEGVAVVGGFPEAQTIGMQRGEVEGTIRLTPDHTGITESLTTTARRHSAVVGEAGAAVRGAAEAGIADALDHTAVRIVVSRAERTGRLIAGEAGFALGVGGAAGVERRVVDQDVDAEEGSTRYAGRRAVGLHLPQLVFASAGDEQLGFEHPGHQAADRWVVQQGASGVGSFGLGRRLEIA